MSTVKSTPNWVKINILDKQTHKMFLLDGKPLSPDVAFVTPDGTQYPANWLRLSSPEDRAAIGITEVPDPPVYDQRFYWGYDQDGNLIPKDHTQLVTQWKQQTSQTAYTLLFPTDWMIVREFDDGTPADADTKTWRQLIRTTCANKNDSIEATTDTDELAQFITGPLYPVWPTQEDLTQPYPSWTRNPVTGKWEAPVPYPNDGKNYEWDENTQSWILVPDMLPVVTPPLVD
ncbi:MAG: hypothetical protein EHM17_14525 [Verrucomicrobiaceae bacterium]|nr:MAG: hypothetical protein EHM17_14525 [Verrucomicrobiaceae bacterium]